MPDLSYLLYNSHAMVNRGSAGELAIIRTSVSRNAEMHITGCLHRESGRYLQYLEGRAVDILRLCGSICADPRHKYVELLGAGPIESRRFTGWGFSAGKSRLFRSEPNSGPIIEPGQSEVEFLIETLRSFCFDATDVDAEGGASTGADTDAPAP